MCFFFVIYLFIYLFIYSFIHLFIYLFIYLFIHLFIVVLGFDIAPFQTSKGNERVMKHDSGSASIYNPRQKSWDTKQVLPSHHFQC